MTTPGLSPVFAGFRFKREVSAVAVRWYLRYGLSFRDGEELLAERGIVRAENRIHCSDQQVAHPALRP